ncbi:MAG: VWA domain-containing protein [Planctomycetota bacterium]
MARRHRYRRPRMRSFRPGLAAKAPGLMLIVGLVLSAGAHVGLGVVLRDHTFGDIDPAALAREERSVRVKRATFDEIRGSDRDAVALGEKPATADELADRLMQEVETATSDPFDPELDLREVPEPVFRPEPNERLAMDILDLDGLLGELVDTPEELVFDETSAFDAQRASGPGSEALAGDLLARLTTTDGELTSVGGGGSGLGLGGGQGLATGRVGGADAGVGPGVGFGGGSAGNAGDDTGLADGGSGLDFLDFGAIDPADFEPPARLDNDFDYVVTRYDPVRVGGAEPDGYFRVKITGKRSLRKLATMPKDVVFMVDTSRSIPQKTINQIVEGIGQSIRTMNPNDRFNLVFFNDRVRFFAGQPVPPTPQNLEMADRWVKGARARGQTDVNLALRQLLKRDLEPGRVYELVLISDGKPTLGVLDTRELINLITRENDLAASIYCVGIGAKQDNRLLDFLAYRNKGFSIAVERRADIAVELVGLMSRLRYPIITDVQVRFAGQGMDEVYPLTLPNVHQGESFEVFGRFEQPGPFTVQVTGRSAGKPVDLTFRADLNLAVRGGDEVAGGWAFWKLHHLYSEIIRLGERDDLLRQIQLLRQRYELETLY